MGSLNVADAYTGVRYGPAAFRDLNLYVKGHSTKQARDFFRDMLLRNVEHYKNKLDREQIINDFNLFDEKFASIDNLETKSP